MNPVYSQEFLKVESLSERRPSGRSERFSIAAVEMEEGAPNRVNKGSLQELGKAGHAICQVPERDAARLIL